MVKPSRGSEETDGLIPPPFDPFPSKNYSVIYADPPWHYAGGKQHNGKVATSEALKHYPTVKDKVLKTLPIASIAEDKCILFLWVTSPKLHHAIDIGQTWGFTYKTVAFVWDKEIVNPGSYTMSQVELVLAFTRGGIPGNGRNDSIKRGFRNIRQLVQARRTDHSRKPMEVAHRIERMFPNHSKIELFARDVKPRWDSWGLEV